MPNKKLNVLNVQQKIKIINAYKNGKSRAEIESEFKIPKSTLCRILKQSDTLHNLCSEGYGKIKRFKKSENPELEESLVMWMKQCRQNNIPITGPLIKEKAIKFCKTLGAKDFKFSNGWLDGFKKRHDIVFRKICGDSNAVDTNLCDTWTENLPILIKNYSPKDIFNADETALFFKCLPNKTLTFANSDCHGGKMSKDRITVLLCSNMSGTEKLPLFVIGKFAKPRCLKNIKSLPVEYYSNKKAWMTSALFRSWLISFDKSITAQKRKILLFIDNCTAHKDIPTLKSIIIEYLPARTTSKLQPLDQGIIQNFKTFYRKEIVTHMVNSLNDNIKFEINILHAMRFSRKAWYSVTKDTITNCFKKCGFKFDKNNEIQQQNIESLEPIEADNWQSVCTVPNISFNDYVNIDGNVPCFGSLTDEEIISTVCEENDEEDEDPITITRPNVTASDATTAVETLRNYFENQSNTNIEIFDQIIEIENSILKINNNFVQSKITNFF